jgi:hypothetical protein
MTKTADRQEDMMNRTVTLDLLDQWHRTLAMVWSTIEVFDDEQWRTGLTWFHTPARVAYHLVESLDVYFVAARAGQELVRGARFGGNWSELSDEDLPGQADLLEYLDEVQARMEAEFVALDDGQLAAPFDVYPWSGSTRLGHYVYAHRHTMHHLGGLAVLAAHHGHAEDNWR